MKKLVIIALTTVLVLSIPVLRASMGAARALREAQLTTDPSTKIELLFQSARWNYPGNPWSREARDALRSLAGTEQPAEIQEQAQQALRRAYFETRSALTALPAELQAPAEEARIRWLVPYEPNYAQQAVTHLFFWGWLLSTIFCVYRSFTSDGQLLRGALIRTGVWSFLFLAGWILSLQTGS